MPLSPLPTRDEQIALGLTPPREGDGEREPETKVKKLKTLSSGVFRRALVLSDEKKELVKKTLKAVWKEWETNTSQLRSKLRRANDIMEGVKEPKTFPWANCSNLHVPLIEIHITILHSIVSTTMLDNDPIAFVKILTDGVAESVDNDIEKFLNWTCKIKLKIDQDLSDIYWNAYRDGTALGDLDWVEEYGRQYDIFRFTSPDEFAQQFPTPENAGMSQEEYDRILLDIVEKGEIQIKVEETVVRYRGPKLRVVELKDFVMVPTAAPTMDYAQFVGDLFVQRGDYFRRKMKDDWFDKEETQKLLASSGLAEAPDQNASAQDQIEGIGRTRILDPDEYLCLQGVLRINLSDDEDEPERMYLIAYDQKTDALLRIEDYPYWHNRMKYIAWRFKKRSNRFLGQSIYDQLIDINDEVDTQHNQRIDSRTITTVPSFLKLETANFDPTREDQRFYPGVTFKVNNMKEIQQFAITQTDMGQSQGEEQNLMYMADLRTGASQARGSGRDAKDARASGKKIQLQLQQSSIRADDHMRELKIGTAECLSQILELYYQFSPETITYAVKDKKTGEFVKDEIMRQKLRHRNMIIEVARTTIMDNPTQLAQKALTIYEILSKEPLIATNMMRRRELVHRLLNALRERDIDKLVPSVDDMIKELNQQSAMGSPVASPGVQNLQGHLQNSPNGKGQSHEKKEGQAPIRAAQTGTASLGE